VSLPYLREVERRAEEMLPAEVHRYFAQGSGAGVTAAEASDAWRAVRLVPRVLMDVTHVEIGTRLLDTEVATPVGLAPTTLQRAAHPDGEVATAAAAAAAGRLMVVSSNAGSTFNDIAATGVSWWLQMYVTSDRTRSADVVQRAVDAGAQGIVLTADTPVVARKDVGQRSVWDVTDPAWVRANFPRPGREPDPATAEKARDLGPQDVAWLAGRFDLPVTVKGVLHPQDARRAVDAGARAVWVSNHGGRQLDRAVPTAVALGDVVGELAREPEVQVYVDGGVRSGVDALVARALGADAVFVGRPALWGLAAAGREGVSRVLGEMDEDLREVLALTGASGWTQVPGDLLRTITGERLQPSRTAPDDL
jgi:4-hydroxymandelate oxidase